ncbi:integrating conjugative element protein, PFL_4701 family [Aromatoleum tolulyticum]|uniref:TIGR03758 family integrating conjugative element protein n=3 Tax=Rhodocyclales TaxID=206389 RepID=A0A848G395_9RHOO|nr:MULTISPECIES: TIGR03758 family integrating conjugative element protein [Rhodocyclales]NML25744.1 TIGR03758 family integrating conjugative element protein [Zoogloea dura]TYC61608.1 TIGR03758 family integrating conjugative element protein [Zoogloea oleivorans]SIP93823.1 integrating conjugative element protein, PFL_4701 family [Aromatoleum tolulyticum]
MTPSADQVAAFQANGGFTPVTVSTVVLGFVFAILLLWGVWAMRTAYVGWAENRLTQRQFLGVVVRFVAMYLVLSFFLLS